MALRDQPYLPLYIKDFMTNQKLVQCSAEATGVYIRLMCIMHKEEVYGKILLRQKFKQNAKQIKNFAAQLAKALPFDFLVIEAAITELIDEKVLILEGDFLIQKRMVRDNEISAIRSLSGKKGGDSTKKNLNNFAQAKEAANSANATVYANEIENVNTDKIGGTGERKENTHLVIEMMKIWKKYKPDYPDEADRDFPALRKISEFIMKREKIKVDFSNENNDQILQVFEFIVKFITEHSFYQNHNISQVEKYIQAIITSIHNGRTNAKQATGKDVSWDSILSKVNKMYKRTDGEQ